MGEEVIEGGLQGGELNAVLRPLRTRHARFDRGEIEFDHGRKGKGILLEGDTKKTLGAVVVFDQLDPFIGSTCSTEIVERFPVDGEIPHGGTVFRGHVGDRGAVGEGEFGGTGPVKFDKLSDHLVLSEDLSDGQGQVGGGGGGGKFPGEVKANDLRGEEGQGLAKHAGLRLDAAHAPTDDAQTVDHGGVGVGSDQGIRVGQEGAIGLFLGENPAGEVFKVHLMDDADARRHHTEGFKGLLAPFQEFIAFAVPLELMLHVQHEGLLRSVDIDLHGMIHDQIHGHEGLDNFWVLF